MGVSEVVGIGRLIFVGGKEKGSGEIGRRGVDKQGGGNAPENDDELGMRARVQIRKLTQ